ncbi:hypothetical protein [Mycolicibacter sinensis]|uniref:hypothetical protein n=1 Tax=Mycolicibacter sinensis (strain JDM601) TaxID=875328 RepID=UPI0007E9E47A|nr:hypothetical protein [Mycolicibacter sinensis]OBH20785.1 hypothetical protein A5694_15520 [Mycolicibacter sinensis]
MSETTTATTATTATADTEVGGEALESPTPESGTGDTTDSGNGRDEDAQPQESTRGRAAGYRQRAQEAETALEEARGEVTRLREQVAGYRRSAVEAAITATGLKPAAVLAVADLDSLIGDDGQPNQQAIAAAVVKARDELGVQRPTIHRQVGMRSGASAPEQPRRDPWSAAFGPADR